MGMSFNGVTPAFVEEIQRVAREGYVIIDGIAVPRAYDPEKTPWQPIDELRAAIKRDILDSTWGNPGSITFADLDSDFDWLKASGYTHIVPFRSGNEAATYLVCQEDKRVPEFMRRGSNGLGQSYRREFCPLVQQPVRSNPAKNCEISPLRLMITFGDDPARLLEASGRYDVTKMGYALISIEAANQLAGLREAMIAGMGYEDPQGVNLVDRVKDLILAPHGLILWADPGDLEYKGKNRADIFMDGFAWVRERALKFGLPEEMCWIDREGRWLQNAGNMPPRQRLEIRKGPEHIQPHMD